MFSPPPAAGAAVASPAAGAAVASPAAGAAVGAAAGAAAVGAALPPPVLPAPHAARTPARIAMIMNRLTRFIERVLLISESICQVHRPRVLIA